ncbi:MAG TPA: glycosyltransferase [Gemmatimonadaceae bacterium]|nr:glycosyltransferase [Gemmatimonadaceae bacterium]
MSAPQPHYAAPERRTPCRLLLLSFHFPPDPAVGALRWQKLATHLAELGCAVDVIALHPDELASQDRRQLEALPPGTRVFGVRRVRAIAERVEHALWQATRTLRRLAVRRPLRGGGGGDPSLDHSTAITNRSGDSRIPSAPPATPRVSSLSRAEARASRRDRRAAARALQAWVAFARDGAWARAAAALALRLVRSGARYDAIVTCGPPHMVHEGGRRVARRTGLPLVVDLRDPWSLVERLPEYLASPLCWSLAARHERRVFRAASLIVANTDAAAAALRERYPALAARVITITNGYDDDEPIPAARAERQFRLVYAGSIYIDRDPRLVFRALERVIRALSLTPPDIGFELVGNVDRYGGVPVQRIAEEEGIAPFVRTGAPRPRHEVMELMAGGTMLVSLKQDSVTAIPSKVFEYMRFPAWLLILAARGSATEMLLRGSDADVVDPDDVDAIASAIAHRVRQFRDGIRPEPIARDVRFSRRSQAERLWQAIRHYCGVTEAHSTTPDVPPRASAHATSR